MKNFFALSSSMLLICTVFTGCGNNDNNINSTNSTTSETTVVSETSETSQIYTETEKNEEITTDNNYHDDDGDGVIEDVESAGEDIIDGAGDVAEDILDGITGSDTTENRDEQD